MQLRNNSHLKNRVKGRKRSKLGLVALYGTHRHSHKKVKLQSLIPSASLLLLFLLSLVFQSFAPFLNTQSYELSDQIRTLTGDSRDDTSEYLKLSEDGSSYSFEVPETTEANTVHTGRIADAYGANLSTDPEQGITVTEKNSKIAVTLIPDFFTQAGQKVEGDHIVYPSGADKLVYTLKYNGLKEDIIVPKYRKDSLSYKFTLRLPAGVEARLDESGNIGIYSADLALFGNISFGSDEDRASIEKARINGEKTNLVMTIPYPIIKDANGEEYTDRAQFEMGEMQQTQTQQSSAPEQADIPEEVAKELAQKTTVNEYQLTVKTSNLKDLAYPIAIDPTMQVNDANSFEGVVTKDSAQVNYSDARIERTNLTGGTLSSWTTAVATLSSPDRVGSEIIEGNLILMKNGSYEYADITADPTLSGGFTEVAHASGTFSGTEADAKYHNGKWYHLTSSHVEYTTEPFVVGKPLNILSGASGSVIGGDFNAADMVVHNNFIYIVTGCTDGFGTGCGSSNGRNLIRSAQIFADGTIGTWANEANTMTTIKARASAIVANNRFYVVGGCPSAGGSGFTCTSGQTNIVESARVNSDGTLGTFTQTTGTPWTIGGLGADLAIYAGYIYVSTGLGGNMAYGQINADGSISTWHTTTTPTEPRSQNGLLAYNERLYVFGGCGAPSCTNTDTVEYSDIAPTGEVTSWTTKANDLTRARNFAGATVYNGYIYVAGGCSNCQNLLTYNGAQNVDYAPINADGSIGAWTASANWSNTGRSHLKAQAYNGYLYVVGGQNTNTGGVYNTVLFSKINNDGSLTTNPNCGSVWCTTQNIGTVRRDFGLAIHNDIMYVVGGSSSSTNTLDTIAWAPINPDGTITTTFETETDTLPGGGRTRMDAEVWGDKIYIAGGCTSLDGSSNCTGPINAVSYADLTSSGTSAWTDNLIGMNKNNYDYGSLMIAKGYLYVIGGQPVPYYDGAQFAKINNDGTVGTWEDSMQSLTFRVDPASATDGTSLFFLAGGGGRDASYAMINNGGPGSTGAWTNDTTNLPTTRGYNKVEVLNGYIYSIAGCVSGNQTTCTATTNVQYAQINNDGSIGVWAATTGLMPRKAFASFTHNGRIYVLGGCTSSDFCSATTSTIQYVTPNADGTLPAWTLNPTDLTPGGLFNFEVVYYDGYVYRAGGNNAPTNSAYAQLNESTGEIGAWTTGTTLAEETRGNGLVAYRGYLYSIGGNAVTGGGPSESTAVQRAAIDPNTHAISAWSIISHTQAGSQETNVNVYNGFVYKVAGYTTQQNNGVEFAPILTNGMLGPWQKAPSLLNTTRYRTGVPIWDGRIYLVNGLNGGALTSSQEYATLQSIPRIGTFSRLYNFESGVRPTKLITRGTKQTGARVNIDYADSVNCGAIPYDAAVSEPDIGYTGANALDINIGSAQTLAQCLLVHYTVDDSYSAVFPDTGNESTITDFDLYFTPNSSNRLRGGRTFINGQDRGLDAAPE